MSQINYIFFVVLYTKALIMCSKCFSDIPWRKNLFTYGHRLTSRSFLTFFIALKSNFSCTRFKS